MKKYLLFLALIVGTSHAFGQSEIFSTKEGAINGYDAVAYFTASKPVIGTRENSTAWRGETWYFASAANLQAFLVNPEKYAPQFGGYCAYGVAEGHKAKTDPLAWTVHDGKLYLNYNQDVLLRWRKDQANYILKANKHWPVVKKEKF